MVSTEAPEDVVGVAFVPGEVMDPAVGYVVAHSSLGVGSMDRLSAWPLGFEQDQVALIGTTSLDDPGVGFITAGGADHFYYFGQLQNCDRDSLDDSCINVCSIDDGGVDCLTPPRLLTGGRHVNGAVMVPGANPMGDSVYFLESNDAMIERLQRVSRNCLETNQVDCPAELPATFDAPDNLDPLGLDFDPKDGSLWWNTWGGAGFNNACVYRFDPTSSPAPLGCVETAPDITKPNRLAVSGAGVFVGTFTPEGMPGPIQRISRCTTPSGNHPVTSFNKLTWPADADGRFVYAALLDTPGLLQVLDAHTGKAITQLDPDGTPIKAVDASNPAYLLFAAGKRIYRWRKPPPPCPMQEGPQVCGNGCVEQGEACDDANDNADDGCKACQCDLP